GELRETDDTEDQPALRVPLDGAGRRLLREPGGRLAPGVPGGRCGHVLHRRTRPIRCTGQPVRGPVLRPVPRPVRRPVLTRTRRCCRSAPVRSRHAGLSRYPAPRRVWIIGFRPASIFRRRYEMYSSTTLAFPP